MKLKLLSVLAVVAVSMVLFLSNELSAANVALGESQQQTLQLATDLESVNAKHRNALAKLEKERQLSERVAEQRDQSHQQINTQSRELQNALFKLTQENKVVADWSSTPIPVNVTKLRNSKNQIRDKDRNQSGSRITSSYLLTAQHIQTHNIKNKRRAVERAHQF